MLGVQNDIAEWATHKLTNAFSVRGLEVPNNFKDGREQYHVTTGADLLVRAHNQLLAWVRKRQWWHHITLSAKAGHAEDMPGSAAHPLELGLQQCQEFISALVMPHLLGHPAQPCIERLD